MPDYFCDAVSVDVSEATRCGAVLAHWRTLKGEAFAPSWHRLDLSALPIALIPFARVVDVMDGGAGFRYRFWGTGMADILGVERTGMMMEKSSSWPSSTGFTECLEVVAARVPYGFSRRIIPAPGDQTFRPLLAYGIRLPLSDDGETVSHILSVTDFDGDRAAWKRIFEQFLDSERPAS